MDENKVIRPMDFVRLTNIDELNVIKDTKNHIGLVKEVSGFVTSWLSFGNRKAIIGAAERMDREFGGSPYGWLMDRQYVKVYNYQNIIR